MTTKEKILEILQGHELMSIATVDEQGLPKVRSVDYAMGKDESVLYFITNKATNKVKEIAVNNNVYISIDHACPTMEELQQLKYLKGIGKAYLADTPKEAQKVFGAIMQKFPYLKNLPGDPSDFLGYRVELDTVYLTDNTVSFGNTEEVKL